MSESEVEGVYRRAVAAWGKMAQEGVLIEEMGEVLKAWNKKYRKRNGGTEEEFFKELVDLQIMVEQMRVIAVDAGFDWEGEKQRKLARLEGLLST